MDELIRNRIHEALDVEQPDSRLRSRILSSLPADDLPKPRVSRRSFRWAGGFVAALLAVAVVAGLLYSRAALSPPRSTANIARGTASITEYPIPAGSGGTYGPIAVGPDGNLFIGTGGAILKLSQSGSFTKYTVPTTDKLLAGGYPNGITTGPDGNIWFTESRGQAGAMIDGNVFKMTTSGIFTEYAIPIGSSGKPSAPDLITAGPDGNLWFTEPFKGMVAKMTTSGVWTDYAMPVGAYNTNTEGRVAIIAGPDGNLWFTEPNKSMVGKMTTSGRFVEFSLPSAGYEATGITAVPDGDIWITEVSSRPGSVLAGRVARLTPSGRFTEYAIPNANSYPYGMIPGRDGNLWFIDGNNVARMTTAGVFTEYPVPASPGWPAQLASSSSLTNFFIWFLHYPGGLVGVLTPGHDPLCPSCYP